MRDYNKRSLTEPFSENLVSSVLKTRNARSCYSVAVPGPHHL